MATIQGVYVALFGRPADPTGLTYFNGVTKNGADLSGIGDLASTQEYKDRFAGQNNTQIVNSIYQSLFGRDAEAAGLTFFVNALNTGSLNIKNIAIAILDGAQGSDKTIVTTKVAAADLYTKSLDTATEIGSYQGNAAAAQGRAFLATVSTTVPTQAAVDAAITAMVGAGAAGATIALTAGNDDLSLTKGIVNGSSTLFTTDKNDTITGTAATYNAANDKIDGGLGVDTFNVTIAANATVLADTLKNVEIINVTSDDGLVANTPFTFAAAEAKQAQQIWNNASLDALVVTGISSSTTVGLKGAIAEATTFTYADTAGTNTANLSIDGATVAAGKAVTIAATEIINISNSGTSSVGALTLDAAQTINISGTGALTLGVASATVDTINASSFSGNLTANFSGNDALKVVTAGTGNDTITVGTTHANDLTVNGGAGTDTLTVVAEAGAPTKTIVLTGGDGADIFQIGSGAALDNVAAVDTAANLVKTLVAISDFNKSADAIKVYTGAANSRDVLLDAELANIASKGDLLAATQQAAAYTDAGKVSVFIYSGDAYIFNDSDSSGTLTAGDALVKVTGVSSVADFTAANFQVA